MYKIRLLSDFFSKGKPTSIEIEIPFFGSTFSGIKEGNVGKVGRSIGKVGKSMKPLVRCC